MEGDRLDPQPGLRAGPGRTDGGIAADYSWKAPGPARLFLPERGSIFGTVVTDSAEVFRLGTAKAEENLEFRRYLSAHGTDEKTFQVIAADIQKQIDCTTCANCCRCSIVPVSGREIANIAAHLGATPETVFRACTVPDPEAPSRRILASSRQGCVFLTGNLCRIYAARPDACRDFPHIAVGTHTLGGRPSSHGRWAALCPIVYNAIETYKRVTGFHPHHGAGKQAGRP
jgi:Fe-S-cluster containining protein